MNETPLIGEVLFWIFVGMTLLSAIGLLVVRDLFKVAMLFITLLVGLAAIFILLNADFLGAIQILVNVGAVSIILIVTIMFIRDVGRSSKNNGLKFLIGGALAMVALAAVIGVTAVYTDWGLLISDNSAAAANILGDESTNGVLNDSVSGLGSLLLGQYLIVFEIIGVLLVATILGAITIMRFTLDKKDKAVDEGL